MNTVTIAIPTYRRAELLRRAIASSVSQSYSGALEILVVENPAEDDAGGAASAAQVCAGFADPRLRHVRNATNLGMVGNWNRCIELASGRWVVILHDDDALSPYHLDAMMALAGQHPQLRMIGCDAIVERAGDPRTAEGPPPPTMRAFMLHPGHFLLGNPFFASGVMFERDLGLTLGGFDSAWYPTMDHRFWMALALQAPAARIQQPLLRYHIGDNASMQPQVLMTYMVNDWRQRGLLLAQHWPSSQTLAWYSRVKPYFERRFLQQFFGVSLPEQKLEHALSATGWRSVARGLRWSYLPIRLLLQALSLLLSRRLPAIDSGRFTATLITPPQ